MVHFPEIIPDVPVSGIAFDSRSVSPGDIFVALEGGSFDGHKFIPTAISKGASAIVGRQNLIGISVPYVQVDKTRSTLAFLSAAFNNFPAHSLTMIGVTGTDGKTTTVNLIYHILRSAGIKAGMISTVNAILGDNLVEDTGYHVTTPESPQIQSYLARMVENGLTHVVLEVTSHGLAQERVTACDFDIGVVTNITHEHLDYHGSYEAYFQAKARLFTDIAVSPKKEHENPRFATLNLDDRSYEELNKITSVRQISYSLQHDRGGDLWAEDIQSDRHGVHFTTVMNRGCERFHVDCHLSGEFNVSNCLAAIGATVYGLGIPYEAAQQGIKGMKGLVGRMEHIDLGQKFSAIVDFAHTPFALEKALTSARKMTSGRVITVFGSAGLRDRMKRRMMAEISIRLADYTILTAEDPRTEDLNEILAEMAEAAVISGGIEGETFWRIPDRGEAIRAAVKMAHSGDLVISCGKGHEQSMCFGDIEYPWDDGAALRFALAEQLGIEGYDMPYLPTMDVSI